MPINLSHYRATQQSCDKCTSHFTQKNLIIHELFCHIYFENFVAESQATQLFNESQERATMISENF